MAIDFSTIVDDLHALSEDQMHMLRRIVADVVAEQVSVETIPLQVANLTKQYLEARDTKNKGDGKWEAPTGPFDAYPLDWTVKYKKKTYVSLTDNNTGEPGVATTWKEVV
jgi:hypothetical protein